jgi:hypothetical protein
VVRSEPCSTRSITLLVVVCIAALASRRCTSKQGSVSLTSGKRLAYVILYRCSCTLGLPERKY